MSGVSVTRYDGNGAHTSHFYTEESAIAELLNYREGDAAEQWTHLLEHIARFMVAQGFSPEDYGKVFYGIDAKRLDGC